MKKNLLKILAIGAIAVSMGACSSEKPQTVNITELLTINSTTKGWELEGKLVKIENLVCQGKYGNTIIGGSSVGNTIVDLRGVEIQTKKAPTFTIGSGYGADITAVGRVVDVNGRLTLQKATVTVNSERDYDNPPADGSAKYSGGLPMSYCPADYLSRSLWDGYFGRTFSGALYEGTFQLATVPGTLSATAATSFQVVFPGENIDVEDEENYSLIKVNVPNEVSDNAIESFNTFFADKKAGDFVTLCGLLQYDSEANLGMGYVLENYWQQAGLEEPASAPDILYDWDEVEAAAYGFVTPTLPELSSATATDAINAPFSYTFDTGYYDKDPSSLFSDPSSILIFEDTSDMALVEVVANLKPSAAEDYLTAVQAKLAELDYELLAGSVADGAMLFGLGDALDNPVAELIVELSDSGSYVTMDFISGRQHHTAVTLAADISAFASYYTSGQLTIQWGSAQGMVFSDAIPLAQVTEAKPANQTNLMTVALTALMFVPDYCMLVAYGFDDATAADFEDNTGYGVSNFYVYFCDANQEVLGIVLAYQYPNTSYMVAQFYLMAYPTAA